jgi:membrane protein DedA with SNARE-associated domain
MLSFITLASATLVSEDLACVAAGILVQRSDVSALNAIAACTVGIFLGDVGLWCLGRLFGATALRWRWLIATVTSQRVEQLRGWLDRRAGRAIVASRFLPGTRLPLYLIAGFVRLPLSMFAQWAILATCLWTPALVMLTATLGDTFVTRLTPFLGASLANLAVVLTVIGCLRWIRGRQQRPSAVAITIETESAGVSWVRPPERICRRGDRRGTRRTRRARDIG